MNRLRGLAVFAIVVFSCGVAANNAQAFSVSYDQKVTRGRESFTGKVAIKDEMFRMEAKVEGKGAITIRNSEGLYTYMPEDGLAMKLPSLDQGQQPVEHADNYQAYLNKLNAEHIGTETINGYACDVYRFKDPALNGITTAWVWKKKSFPIKIETDGSDGKTTI